MPGPSSSGVGSIICSGSTIGPLATTRTQLHWSPARANTTISSCTSASSGVVVDAALLAHTVDGDDVAVAQPGRRLGLVVEALQPPRVERGRERQHLQGHPPPQGD